MPPKKKYEIPPNFLDLKLNHLAKYWRIGPVTVEQLEKKFPFTNIDPLYELFCKDPNFLKNDTDITIKCGIIGVFEEYQRRTSKNTTTPKKSSAKPTDAAKKPSPAKTTSKAAPKEEKSKKEKEDANVSNITNMFKNCTIYMSPEHKK